jgi:hypothetical protein
VILTPADLEVLTQRKQRAAQAREPMMTQQRNKR